MEYYHVGGLLDNFLRWDQLSRVQRENCLMDDVAKSTLLDSFVDDVYINSVFLHEQVVVKVNGQRITGSPYAAIGRHGGIKLLVSCSTQGR